MPFSLACKYSPQHCRQYVCPPNPSAIRSSVGVSGYPSFAAIASFLPFVLKVTHPYVFQRRVLAFKSEVVLSAHLVLAASKLILAYPPASPRMTIGMPKGQNKPGKNSSHGKKHPGEVTAET
jgi:hypothetical protein